MQPLEFETARKRLGDRLVHYGYAETEAGYARLLWSSDVVLSTALHEFFGVSVVEALYCGARPVLPNRLSYPELLATDLHKACLYDDFEELLALLRAALTATEAEAAKASDPGAGRGVARSHVARFDWSVQAPAYDELISSMA
jgi:glycosyltransferase involved in cell wall biosynthesis